MTFSPTAFTLRAVNDETRHQPLPRGPKYDEQLALQRLEQLRRDIQTARRRREQAVAEFEAFIASFREPTVPQRAAAPAPRVEPTPPRPIDLPLPPPEPDAPQPIVEARDAAQSPESPAVAALPAPDPAPALPEPPPVEASAPWPAITRRRSARRVWKIAVAAGLGAVAVAGFVLLRSGDESSPAAPLAGNSAPASARPGAEGVAPSRGPGSSAPSSPPGLQTMAPASAPPAGGLRLELVARQPVWIRVTVDGRRRMEREVPEGFRVTLDAERAVAIRAGDAGALMVGENGRAPAPLGREGQVLTRIFPSPANR